MAAGATELATAYLSLVPSLKGAAEAITKQLGGVDVSKAGSAMGGKLAQSIGPTFGSKVASSLSSLGETASEVASQAASKVTTAISGSSGWQTLSGLGSKYLAPIEQAAASVASRSAQAFSRFATAAGSSFSTLFSKLPPAAQTALSAVGGAFSTLGGKISSTLSPVISAVGAKIGGLPGAVKNAFSSLPSAVGSAIDLVGGAFSRGAGAIKKVASSLGEHIKGTLTTAMAVGGAAVVAGMGLITSQIGAAVSRADTLHNFPKIMSNLGYSAQDAAKSVKTMSDRLIGLPTSLDQMTGMTQKLAPLTGSLQKATDVSLALNDALLAGGKSTQLQSNAMEQYSQMLSVGKVDMMAWRSMVNAMPGQMDQLSKSLLGANANQMDLYNAMKDGKVTFSQFNDAIMKLDKQGVNGFASFAQQAKDATNGLSTQWTNLKTAIGRGLSGLVDAIGYTRITGALSGITSSVNTAFNGINNMVGPIVNAISDKMHQLSEAFNSGHFNGIKSIIAPLTAVGAAIGAGGLAGAFEKLGRAVPALAGPLGKLGGPLRALGGPFGIVISAVGALIAQSPQLRATFGNTMQSTFTTLGKALEACKPALDSLVNTFNTLLNATMPAVNAVLNATIPLIGGVAKVIAVLMPTLANLVKVVLPPLAGIILAVMAAMKGYAVVVGAVAKAQKLWSVATKAAAVVQGIFNATLSANPIGLLVLAIGAAVAALTAFFTKTETGRRIWAGFTSWVQTSWQKVAGFLTNSWSGITGVFQNSIGKVKQAWSGFTGWFSSMWSALATGISAKWQSFTSWIVSVSRGLQNAIGTIWTVIGAVILRPLQLIRDAVNSTFGWITGFITGQMEQTHGIVYQVLYGIYQVVQTVGTLISGTVSTFVNAVRTVIVTILDLIKGDWSGAWSTISGFFTDTWQGIVDAAAPYLQGLADAISGFMTVISTTWNMAWSVISGFFMSIWNGITAFLAPILGAINATISTTLGTISSAWSAAWSAVSGFFKGVWNGMVSYLSPVVASLQNTISSALAFVSSVWNSAWSAVSGFFANIWNSMTAFLSTKVSQIGSIVGGIKNVILNALSGAGSWLVNTGRQIVNGLGEGIKSGFRWLRNIIGDMGSNIVDWAMKVLHIHSPSRVMRDKVGVMVGLGVAAGITDSQDTVNRSLSQVAQGLTLDGYSFGLPAPALYGGGYVQAGKAGQTDGMQDVVDAIHTLQAALPRILDAAQPDGISERDFARLVRQYA